MQRKYILLLAVGIIFGAQRIQAMEHVTENLSIPALREHVEITFNNYPDDTVILLNNGLVKITPTHKNVTVNGVKSVEIKKTDGLLLRLLLIHELQKTKLITVAKNTETGEYSISIL